MTAGMTENATSIMHKGTISKTFLYPIYRYTGISGVRMTVTAYAEFSHPNVFAGKGVPCFTVVYDAIARYKFFTVIVSSP